MARPILPWRSPLVVIPDDGADVWIRRLPFYDRPVRGRTDGWAGVVVETTWQNHPDEPFNQPVSFTEIHTWKFQFKDAEDSFRATYPQL